MKLFLDTDTNEEYAIIQLQDIKLSPEKTNLFIQEFFNLYNKIEGRK